MEEKNKTYTAADFARYHAGTMPVAEMHALEKDALEDPFLADALEGYTYSESPEKDMAQLRELLTEKRKKNKAFSIALLTENKWWRIAAMFIILFGVAYLFYININHRTDSEIAKNDHTASPKKVEAPSPILKDLDSGNDDIAFDVKKPAPARIHKPSLPKTNADKAPEKIREQIASVNKENAASLMMEKTNTLTDSLALPQPVIKQDSLKQYVFKGLVTDDSGAPIPYVSIRKRSSPEGTITDKDGRFSFPSADSSVNIVAQGIGFDDKNSLLTKGELSNITLEKNMKNLDEVIITAYSTKQKRALTSRRKNLRKKAAGIAANNLAVLPFPVNGNFNKYLQEKLVPVYNENNEKVSGQVVLSFIINKKGRPRHVEVLKSTCKECEEQAMQLLENGPDWQGPTDIKGTVEIKF